MDKVYIGQKAVIESCASAKGYIGTVIDYSLRLPNLYIIVEHPLNKIRTNYDPSNVKLIPVEV